MRRNIQKRPNKVTVLYTDEEKRLVDERAGQSGCRTTGRYIREVSLERPVKVFLRDASFDAFVGEAIRQRKELQLMREHWALAGYPAEPVLDLLRSIEDITTKIYALCMSKYTTAAGSAGSFSIIP